MPGDNNIPKFRSKSVNLLYLVHREKTFTINQFLQITSDLIIRGRRQHRMGILSSLADQHCAYNWHVALGHRTDEKPLRYVCLSNRGEHYLSALNSAKRPSEDTSLHKISASVNPSG